MDGMDSLFDNLSPRLGVLSNRYAAELLFLQISQ